MMNKLNNSPARVAGQHRLPLVRVKVFRTDGKITRVHPPDGDAKNWWQPITFTPARAPATIALRFSLNSKATNQNRMSICDWKNRYVEAIDRLASTSHCAEGPGHRPQRAIIRRGNPPGRLSTPLGLRLPNSSAMMLEEWYVPGP